MRPRFVADYRALFWAFVLFPLVPALAYAEPALALYLVPCSLYLAYCSGVLAHNHNHCPMFRARRANAAYGAWLSFFYGFPIFAWIPTHNGNHHRYLNGEGDLTRTTRHARANTLGALFGYPFRCSAWQLPAVLGFAARAIRHPRRRRTVLLQTGVLVLGHLALLTLALAWHGFFTGAFVYGVAVLLPALFAPWSMMFTNYVQHVDCDPGSPDDHSRNFVSPFWNWFVFDNGYHTVHHERPGEHWSRYRALHAARAARIDPRLNVSSIFAYCARAYLLEPWLAAQRRRALERAACAKLRRGGAA